MSKSRIVAMVAHSIAQQVRRYTGEPYHNHPRRVRALIEQHVPDATPAMLEAADLHDVLEDTQFTLQLLEREFSPETVRLVVALTNVEQPDMNRAKRKRMNAERLRNACNATKTIKLADRIDNLKCIIKHDPEFAVTYVKESHYLLVNSLYGGNETLWCMLADIILGYYAIHPQNSLAESLTATNLVA